VVVKNEGAQDTEQWQNTAIRSLIPWKVMDFFSVWETVKFLNKLFNYPGTKEPLGVTRHR
jgi:hypothetical protein